MSWKFSLDDLAADRDLALTWLRGDDPNNWRLEIVGRLYRWLEQPAQASVYFRRAADHLERHVNAAGKGDFEDFGREGGLLLLAGDSRAREWLSRARDGADEVRNRGIVVGLSYLLGDDDTALQLADSESGQVALLAAARRNGDAGQAEQASTFFVQRIRADRLKLRAARAQFHFSDYDWLEESYRLAAELAGEPVPDHATMLSRAGLIGSRTVVPPEPELPMGRWEIGDASLVVPARGAAKATLRPGLVLEIEGEPPQYAVSLYEDNALLGGVSPVSEYSSAALDQLRAYAPEAEPVFSALLDAARA